MYKVVVYEITGDNDRGYAEIKEIFDASELSFDMLIHDMEEK